MKIWLLIYVISLQPGQPTDVQRILELDLAACNAAQRSVMEQLPNGCGGRLGCQPAFIVRTACVVGS
jgi:hypothetical protein